MRQNENLQDLKYTASVNKIMSNPKYKLYYLKYCE